MKQTLEQLKRIVLDLKHYFEKSLPLILIGVGLGYAFANHLETQQLKDCRDNSLDGSY